MLKDYSAMSRKELATELERLRSDLKDFEETSQFYLMKVLHTYQEKLLPNMKKNALC